LNDLGAQGAGATEPGFHPAIRVVAMPADTNPYGDIFGGWLMSIMDSAAGTVAARSSKGRAVTIAVDGMTFHQPVKVGDVVSVYAEVVSTGRTSMKIDVEAWSRLRGGEDTHKVTHATFTFVAIGEDGRPRVIET
jgi:acyl-CoA thioesterase YciA